MIEDIETPAVAISPAAAQAVRDLLVERNLEGYALRAFAAGSSCCGVQFGLALDNHFGETDTVIEAHGVKLVVDEVSLESLRGGSIDFVDDPQHGRGFAIHTPHAGQGCSDQGCGGSCPSN